MLFIWYGCQNTQVEGNGLTDRMAKEESLCSHIGQQCAIVSVQLGGHGKQGIQGFQLS